MTTSADALLLEPADIESLREPWMRLADRAGNPFLTWEWASTWWRHWGGTRRQLVTACRDPRTREIVAILPIFESATRPLRVLRLLGHGPADRLGLVCAPAHRAAAARAFGDLLAGDVDWDVFVGEQLPADEGWTGLLGGRVISRESTPVLDLGDAGWEALLASRSANLRQQVRRKERLLARAGELRYRLATDPAELDTLFSLHAARWGEDASDALAPGRRPFHREFAALALERGWLRLWFLELDGRPVAGWYGLRFGGSEWFYQSGRDPALDGLSVGFTLLVHSIRAAADDRMRTYHFLRGAEPYKQRLASADPGLETTALPRGVAGRAAVRAGPALLSASRGGRGTLRHAARRAVQLADGAADPRSRR